MGGAQEVFYWGSATASHQVEGGTKNDWSAWELQNAERLVREAKRNWEPWQQEKFPEMFSPENYISGRACDHYHRYEEDFDLAKQGGQNAYRFSIEWSRVEPEEGIFDEKELHHYMHVVRALRARGLEPFITLWHWTLPVWLAEKGGVLAPDFPLYFSRYAEKMANALGKDVIFWITLNEPDVMTSHAYLRGVWPPQQKNRIHFFLANNALVNAHKKAFESIKKTLPHAKIGIAKHNVAFVMKRKTWINRLLKRTGQYLWNDWWLYRIQRYQDFIGLNHYNRNVIDNGFSKNENARKTDFGWEFFPQSLFQALIDLRKFKKPIYVTENGIADASEPDDKRVEFLREATTALFEAKREGADVRGYFYWSLLDNFEWDKGFWLRFGLVAIDRATLKRTPRKSFWEYKKIIETK